MSQNFGFNCACPLCSSCIDQVKANDELRLRVFRMKHHLLELLGEYRANLEIPTKSNAIKICPNTNWFSKAPQDWLHVLIWYWGRASSGRPWSPQLDTIKTFSWMRYSCVTQQPQLSTIRRPLNTGQLLGQRRQELQEENSQEMLDTFWIV